MDDIVLVDTRSTYDNIICVSKPLDETVGDYFAISYRWGDHPQWRTKTPNYMGSVTSISRYNLVKLCKVLRKIIPYIWIDAVCINQADTVQRKPAIKNMDRIYERSERVVAVPDLCFCIQNRRMEMVTAEDIILVVEDISGTQRNFMNQNSRPSAQREEMRISERTIGLNGKKLDIIILRGDGVLIPFSDWDDYADVEWDVKFNQHTLIKHIINSRSSKYIDRLFAILPHVDEYKKMVPKLLEEGRAVNSMI
ncbi:hypothetical protein EC973_002954 [Apophysomyces ossiformis]|uniref:Heterokaryon incompatibility domain-containing protein n=1 Tax=Apophysomyces ossiformis TaxID=679940 RepID=A0A8H7BLY2_9FUNG|nr:hypothetical protein EC973_002954 [Apophysomyces ossiformis]